MQHMQLINFSKPAMRAKWNLTILPILHLEALLLNMRVDGIFFSAVFYIYKEAIYNIEI